MMYKKDLIEKPKISLVMFKVMTIIIIVSCVFDILLLVSTYSFDHNGWFIVPTVFAFFVLMIMLSFKTTIGVEKNDKYLRLHTYTLLNIFRTLFWMKLLWSVVYGIHLLTKISYW